MPESDLHPSPTRTLSFRSFWLCRRLRSFWSLQPTWLLDADEAEAADGAVEVESPTFGHAGLSAAWYRFRRHAQYGTILAGLMLGLVWGWPPGFVVAGLSLVAYIETRIQLRRNGGSVFLSLLLDATLIGAGVFWAELPYLALPVPFLTNAATALMLLPLRRAIWVWGHDTALMLTVLAAYSHFGRTPLSGTRGTVVAVIAAVIFGAQLLTMIWFLERSIREYHFSRVRVLRETIEGKNAFIASVSHELRTPLTAIVGFAHILDQNPPAPLPPDVAELVDGIRQGSLEVSLLVEDLLTHARSSTGSVSLSPEKVDLHQLVTQSARTCRAAHPKTSIVIEGGPTFAWADPLRVRQVLRNLLTNAARHGGPRVTVTVSQRPTAAELTVDDDGPGIPLQDHDRVFRPYQSLGSEPSQPGRLGLGLPISRHLTHLMGGQLTYTRTHGKTRFRLHLPRPTTISAHTTGRPTAGSQQPHPDDALAATST